MPKSVVTLGTFDGVHRGHQALLHKVVSRARAIRARSDALIFNMPPRHAGEPLVKPVLLTTLSEKRQILKRYGIKNIQVLEFDHKTASTLPDDFFHHTIVQKHSAQEMVVGPKVAFGKNRAGRLSLLRRLGKKYGVRIHVVPEIGKGRMQVSSRHIRALLLAGQVEKASKLLGYPYSFEGKVVHGDKRGRHLGFPTANIEPDACKILPPGVFYVKVYPPGQAGVCNVGVRPTFTPEAQRLHCEVFLLHPKRGQTSLYGRRLRIVFLRRLRAEKRFSSPVQLQRQIQKDVALVRRLVYK